jgi:hypothetical protein
MAMTRNVLAVTISAFILVAGVTNAPAQQPTPTGQHEEHHPQQQTGQGPSGMMGPGGMMGRGMMGSGGMMGPGMMHRCGMMGPAMRIIFGLMDADGDGTISLQEFQAAHERIFKAMDANKDGSLTLEEMQAFIVGGETAQKQQ